MRLQQWVVTEQNCSWPMLLNFFWLVINEFSYKAGEFVRLGWKSFTGTNTLAELEN
jgi:hypothetical protein